jgi:serine phosphatase RsbU (regulator of sigma subunit)/anti-sigma regulatory factor (Ser/Thr protein kinase)
VKTDSAKAPRREFGLTLRLEAACDFAAVRAANLAVREWLAEHGLPEAELGAWELALAEAGNNAVEYVETASQNLPVVIEIIWGEHEIEARITDHTPGFDWPDEVDLPDVEAEGGRGLFLIKSLTDHAVYLRGKGENVMRLRRTRPPAAVPLPDAAQLQNRLADSETALMEMTTELSSSYESLTALFRYSSELGAHSDLKDFSRRLLKDLMQITESDCAVLRLASSVGEKLETLLVLPEDKSLASSLPLSDALTSVEVGAARNREDIWFGPEEPMSKNDPLRAVLPAGHGVSHAFFVANQLVGVATLGRFAANKPFIAAQVNLLHTFVDFLAIQIVNARLLDERTVARVTRRELEIAAGIQRSLLPEKIPACPPFQVIATCRNAQQVGGDFYDLIPAGDGALLLVIADVMGKGVPAALFAAVLRSTIRSMPQFFNQPGELLATANRTLYSDLSRVDMFITAQVAYLHPREQKIIYANAGHCPLLVWKSGVFSAEAANESGFPLGIEPLTRYAQTEVILPPGSAVLLHTDGLTETRNAAGEMFGESRLRESLTKAADQTDQIQVSQHLLISQLADFRGSAPLADDLTFIFIRHLT